mmetsp:Transcript_139002/g.387685  ORF Transcript_139002/g.387685 Transcript_139002/m.387685 type:complete len:733 (-) Transcript_139002:116-2314(-)
MAAVVAQPTLRPLRVALPLLLCNHAVARELQDRETNHLGLPFPPLGGDPAANVHSVGVGAGGEVLFHLEPGGNSPSLGQHREPAHAGAVWLARTSTEDFAEAANLQRGSIATLPAVTASPLADALPSNHLDFAVLQSQPLPAPAPAALALLPPSPTTTSAPASDPASPGPAPAATTSSKPASVTAPAPPDLAPLEAEPTGAPSRTPAPVPESHPPAPAHLKTAPARMSSPTPTPASPLPAPAPPKATASRVPSSTPAPALAPSPPVPAPREAPSLTPAPAHASPAVATPAPPKAAPTHAPGPTPVQVRAAMPDAAPIPPQAAPSRAPLARKEAPKQQAAQPEKAGTPAPPHTSPPHPLLVSFLVALLCTILVVANNLYVRGRSKRNAEEATGSSDGADPADARPDSDDEVLTTEPLSEDTYGMAIASMVRDMSRLTKETGSNHKNIRIMRIGASLKLLLANMSLQIFLLACIAKFATARAVLSIRDAYSDFEKHMYSGHVYISTHNSALGVDDKYFNASLFQTLPDNTKETACRIPFAQPQFLFVILLIWSLMVVGEIKQSIQVFERLVLSTSTTESMAHATQSNGDEGDVIVKLTVGMKVWISLFIVLPRVLIASVLLWLGCRWLAATTDFQDLLLNAVGLEFVLLLKELLYTTLVPGRDKRDTSRMHVSIAHEASRPSPLSFLGSFLWGAVALAWVYLYIFCLQAVLPGYRWDVHDVCAEWMNENYAGWA